MNENTPSQNITIYAKDAEEGKFYLTAGLFYKLKILKKCGEGNYITSVLVEYEGAQVGRVTISGETALIPYDENLVKKLIKPKNKEATMPETTPTATVPASNAPVSIDDTKEKEKSAKMSDIIKPLLMDGVDPEKIVDAVIAVFPERAVERAALLGRIKGPRKFNLIAELKKKNQAIPEHLLVKKVKKVKAVKEVKKVVDVPEGAALTQGLPT